MTAGDPGAPPVRPTATVVVGAILALFMIGLAALLFVQTGDAGDQRLALFFAALGPTIVGLAALLRADTAASQVNGTIDARIESAVVRATAQRRSSDVVPDEIRSPIVGDDPDAPPGAIAPAVDELDGLPGEDPAG